MKAAIAFFTEFVSKASCRESHRCSGLRFMLMTTVGRVRGGLAHKDPESPSSTSTQERHTILTQACSQRNELLDTDC